MAVLRKNLLSYLATLLTLSTILLSLLLDRQCCTSLRFLAPVFGICALALMIWPMITLQRYGQSSPGQNYMQATVVVDRDLYAVVRHPQYLGYICLDLTFLAVTPHWLILFVVSAAIAAFYLLARQEEDAMRQSFGLAYQAYMDRVPRFNIFSGLIRKITSR